MKTLFLVPWLLAQAPDTPPATDPDTRALEEELARSLAADAAAAPRPAPAPIRSKALLNPEMSVIGTISSSFRTSESEPDFSAHDDPAHYGITVQELEFTFAADADPYFKMRAFLAIPKLEGIEVEEAYLLTTSLPANLLLKAGSFRSAFGRNNEQHLHMQDFARRPFMTAYLGEDGLRGPGAQLSVLLPLPWFVTVYGEVFTLGDELPLSAVASIDQFFELNDCWSLMVGLNAANVIRGAGDHAHDAPEPEPLPAEEPEREWLAGFDVYVKWKPANVTETYAWVAFTMEYLVHKEAHSPDLEGAGYAQLVAQVSRRWRVGLRGEAVAYPDRDILPSQYVGSASVAFLPTEFSRVRFTYSYEHDPADSDRRNHALFLQLEGAIGAHGAHPF